MPVDLFPDIDMPVVVVATFYSGMPPQQIEADITDTFERFFTLGSGCGPHRSRSLTGVSLIKIYFKPGPIRMPHSAMCRIWRWPIFGACRRVRCLRWYWD